MKIFKRFLAILVIIILIVVLLAGYLGFIPGISSWFESDKPRNLDAVYTDMDLEIAQRKFHQKIVDPGSNSPHSILTSAESNPIKADFTGKEFAAHLDATHPIEDVQVVFQKDGTFEATGIIETERIASYAQLLGYNDVSESEVIQMVDRYLPGRPPFYIKGTGLVENDKPTVNVLEVQVGRLPISTSWAGVILIQYANTVLERVPNLSIKSMKVEEGMLKFDGTTPSQFPNW